jgi:hypothetical protein
MACKTRHVCWRPTNVVSVALNVAELAGRCAIRRDEYNSGEYDGDAVNVTECRRTNRVIFVDYELGAHSR